MAVWTRDVNSNFNYPNIDIYNVYKDGVLNGYEARPQNGYVMYDTNDSYTEPMTDPETGDLILDENGNTIEIPVTYYYTLAGFPLNFNFDNFSWVAVPRSEVDENYIFGVDEPEHEVM